MFIDNLILYYLIQVFLSHRYDLGAVGGPSTPRILPKQTLVLLG